MKKNYYSSELVSEMFEFCGIKTKERAAPSDIAKLVKEKPFNRFWFTRKTR